MGDEMACYQDVSKYYLVNMHRYKEINVAANGRSRRNGMICFVV